MEFTKSEMRKLIKNVNELTKLLEGKVYALNHLKYSKRRHEKRYDIDDKMEQLSYDIEEIKSELYSLIEYMTDDEGSE